MTIAELQSEFLSSDDKRIAPEDFLMLLAHATGKEQIFLLAHPEYAMSTADEALARSFFRRRLRHEPVAYITGRKEFYGRDFIVTKDTLIPRPETEQLVELVLRQLTDNNQQIANNPQQSDEKITIIDVGTGSGNIIISIAKELKKKYPVSDIRYYAADISESAIAVAQENTRRHNVSDIITFRTGDLLESLTQEISSADEIIIVANLPYLSETIYSATENDVKNFEPRSALVSGQAGLGHYYRLLDQMKHLAKPAMLLLEISPEQVPLLRKRLVSCFPQAEISIHRDLSGQRRKGACGILQTPA